jgi:hypothetical protein
MVTDISSILDVIFISTNCPKNFVSFTFPLSSRGLRSPDRCQRLHSKITADVLHVLLASLLPRLHSR